ncbi:MAG: hypothetical protein JWQ12_2115 [Glaciihabitans sp.]|nr:hypothetical protein [Glaciihabitans sp.]
MTEHPWTSAFAAYDDDSLASLANAGLLRRAHRDVEAGRVSLASADQTHGTLLVGESTVRVTSSGPPRAVCDCVATGTCQHILAASIWIRETAGPDAEPTSRTAIHELLDLSPLHLAKSAGTRATRLARAIAEAEEAATHPSHEQLAVETTTYSVAVTFPGASSPVRFFAGSGFDGMVSDYREQEKAERHLTAIRLIFAANGRTWEWPANSMAVAAHPEQLSSAESIAIADVRASIASLLRVGLAHLGESAADRLASDAVNCRVVGLHRLSRLVTTAAGLAEAVQSHSDEITEPQLARALSETAALCAALEFASHGAVNDSRFLEELRGASRRSFAEAPAVDLIPLDLRWFEAPSGARGAILTCLESDSGEFVTATAARAAGTDPTFRRDGPNLMWGSSAATLTSGAFTLRSPRLSPDGTLATSDLSSIDKASIGPLDRESLDRIAVRNWSTLAHQSLDGARLSFGEPRAKAMLLAPLRFGDLDVKEAAQQLSWQLIDADGFLVDTRIPLGAAASRRADVLIALVEAKMTFAYVLAHRRVTAGRATFEPSSVIVREQGDLRLIALDFARTTAPQTVRPSALRERFNRLSTRFSKRVADLETALAPEHPTVAARLCNSVLDVLDEVVTTGRPRLNERQMAVLHQLENMAHDLAISAVADSITALRIGNEIDHLALMRCYFLIDRALSTAANA